MGDAASRRTPQGLQHGPGVRAGPADRRSRRRAAALPGRRPALRRGQQPVGQQDRLLRDAGRSDYDVELGGDGQAFAHHQRRRCATTPPAPACPGFVIDPAAQGYHPGDDVALITASCPGPCTLVSAAAQRQACGAASGFRARVTPGTRTSSPSPRARRGRCRSSPRARACGTGNSTGGVLPPTDPAPDDRQAHEDDASRSTRRPAPA